MLTRQFHVCMDLPAAPDPDAEFEADSRFVCECGTNFVYREGFNSGGCLAMGWWEAPPLVIPTPRLRDRLIHPRRGS